jgi:hypothetical protein
LGQNAAVDAWLQEACDAVAAASGLGRADLELDADDARAVLDLARIAAHESGARTNAPLVCYIAGLAVRGGSADLQTVARAVRRTPE